MRLKLHVWRQTGPQAPGQFETYDAQDIEDHMSFLEMLDVVNEQLVSEGKEPITFEHDCREGICGQCGVFINGRAHGPHSHMTTCQLHMRSFQDGDTITVEPWRAKAFPVIKDLMVDRSAFDRIIEQGAYISAKTGTAPEANAILIGKDIADRAMDAAACIGCGACVAACKNSSAAVHIREGLAPGPAAAGPARTPRARGQNGRPNGLGRFRQLHEPWLVPERLPSGCQRGLHRPPES
jgi:succinate dehydrogenase / fumarate reductase iron-sulfur subunit